MLLLRSNPLIYPVGYRARFNPSHPASSGAYLTAVATNGNFTNLLNSAPGTAAGSTITPTINGNLGPSLDFSQGGSGRVQFTGMPTAALGNFTFAFMGIWDTVGDFTDVFCNSTAGSGFSVRVVSSNLNVTLGGFFATAVTYTLLANVPYFVGISTDSTSVLNVVIRRLDTGQIYTFTDGLTASLVASTSNGTFVIGNGAGVGTGMGGALSAFLWSSPVLSLTQLMAWASDPWSSWYPRRALNLVGVAAVAGFIPYNPWPQAAPVLAQ